MTPHNLTLAASRRDAMARQKQQDIQRQKKRAEDRWNQSPIATSRLLATLADCLPDNVVIYNESITAGADLLRSLPLVQPGSLFGNQGGGIGQGLPGAIGVKLANPERPVVAVIGDGSAMYTVQSLWTAAHHQIPVVYIILNNRSYRILKYNMNRYRKTTGAPPGRPYPSMDLTQPALDFIDLARGMGVAGKHITEPDDIQPAVQEALSIHAPFVLDVITDGTVPAG
jgi:benzoylformate decarboxylase